LQRIPVGGSGYGAHNHRWQPQRERRPVGHRPTVKLTVGRRQQQQLHATPPV
jgi:hypothetical protein